MTSRKFVRFVVPALFTTAICGLGASTAYAGTHCSATKDKKTSFCFNWDDNDDKDKGSLYVCNKHANGTWSCTMAKTETNPPPSIKDALSNAVSRTH